MTTTYLHRAGLACAAALAFGALTQSAPAQPSATQQQALRANCGADFRAQCARVRPGGKAALECLQEHVEHLSQKCQDAVFATMPVATEAEATLPPANEQHADEQRADAPPAPQPVDEPPPPSRADAEPPAPPPAARAAAEPPPPPPPRASAAEQAAMRQYCRTDYIANCAGIPVGSADALACLRGNLSHLSRACRHAVSATLPRERTPIVSAPPPQAIPTRREARRAEAAAEPPPPPSPPPYAHADDAPPPGTDDAPPSRAERAPPVLADRAPPPSRQEYAPPPRAERAPPPRAKRAPPPVVESRAVRAYCGPDFAAHCPSLRPGSVAASACLRRHTSTLMPRCRRAVNESISALPPGRRSRAALAAREELPPPPPHRRQHAAPPPAAGLARACSADLYRHCRRVRPGHGHEIACLAAHRRALSLRCRTALRISLR